MSFSILLSDAQNGYTALIWASQEGHLEVVKALVVAGEDINIVDNVRSICFMKIALDQKCSECGDNSVKGAVNELFDE